MINILQTNKGLVYCGFLLLLTLLGACGKKGTPKPGEEAPAFSLPSLTQETHSLSDEKGKLVLLSFWTDNCDICKKEFPKIQEYYEQLPHEEFEILAVYIGESATAPKDFKKNFNISFPILTSGQEVAFENYNVRATPTNFLISPEGKVIRKVVGFVDKQQIEGVLYNIKMNK